MVAMVTGYISLLCNGFQPFRDFASIMLIDGKMKQLVSFLHREHYKWLQDEIYTGMSGRL